MFVNNIALALIGTVTPHAGFLAVQQRRQSALTLTRESSLQS
jgi:hypothetical protein